MASFLALAAIAPVHAARAQGDAAAPSQDLSSDPAPPVPRIALTADPLGLYLGHYGFGLELAPSRWHSLWLAPAWTRSGEERGLGLELGYHLWLLGRGLDGPFVGAVAAAGTSRVATRPFALRGGAEAGYQAAWGNVALGLAVGVEYHVRRVDDQIERGPALRLRLAFGWAYL